MRAQLLLKTPFWGGLSITWERKPDGSISMETSDSVLPESHGKLLAIGRSLLECTESEQESIACCGLRCTKIDHEKGEVTFEMSDVFPLGGGKPNG